jgi:hypothetical protein
MELTIQALEKLAPEDLANAINELIKNDFSKLVQLLYRIDDWLLQKKQEKCSLLQKRTIQ